MPQETEPRAHKPANAGHVITISEGDLHKLMDMGHRSISFIDEKMPEYEKSNAALAADLVDLRSINQGILGRLDAIDKRTENDDKHWRGESTLETRAFKDFGAVFTASYKA